MARFDRIFHSNDRNFDLYNTILSPILPPFIFDLKNYQINIKGLVIHTKISSGVPLSGKTHTLIGKANDPGILLQFMSHFYHTLEAERGEQQKKREIKNNLEPIFTYSIYVGELRNQLPRRLGSSQRSPPCFTTCL